MSETTSPNSIASLSFTPLLIPNVVFLGIFAVLLLVHAVLAILFWRFYGYAIGMLGGLLLELLGYVAKVELSHNRGKKDAYIMYIIGLTLGPTFLSSSLYLGVSALQRDHRARILGPIGPRLFATLFILGDFVCLCFIGVGGSLAAIYAAQRVGVDLMIAGLATQVLCTALFCLLLTKLYRRLHGTKSAVLRQWYMLGQAIASTCLFIRCCWRVVELSGGFNGPLASKEGAFIALDSIPMVIMSLLLTTLHPRLWFVDRPIEASMTEGHHSMGRMIEIRL